MCPSLCSLSVWRHLILPGAGGGEVRSCGKPVKNEDTGAQERCWGLLKATELEIDGIKCQTQVVCTRSGPWEIEPVVLMASWWGGSCAHTISSKPHNSPIKVHRIIISFYILPQKGKLRLRKGRSFGQILRTKNEFPGQMTLEPALPATDEEIQDERDRCYCRSVSKSPGSLVHPHEKMS